MNRVKFDRDIFDLAVHKAQLCQHTRAKAWGTNYGKGIKCLGCGKELSELHKEVSISLA